MHYIINRIYLYICIIIYIHIYYVQTFLYFSIWINIIFQCTFLPCETFIVLFTLQSNTHILREKPWFTPMHMHMHMFYNTDKTPIDSFIAHKIYLFPNKPSRPPTTSVLRLNRSNVWAHSNPSLPGIQTRLQCNNKWHNFVRLLCHRAKIAKKKIQELTFVHLLFLRCW